MNQVRVLMLGALFFLLVPIVGQAKEELTTREEVLEFLEEGYQAQLRLGDKERTLEEIDEMMTPYFSDEYIELFNAANLHEANGRFITLGSDFAPYYIPFQQFSDKTTIVIGQEQIDVYEFFPKVEDGPVIYEDHYEAIIVKKVKGKWKVAEYIEDYQPNKARKASSQQLIKLLSIVPKQSLLKMAYQYIWE